MKTFLFMLFMAVMITACSTSPKTSDDTGLVKATIMLDTTGLAAFNEWKATQAFNQGKQNAPSRSVALASHRSNATKTTKKASPVYKTETLSTVSENAAKAPVKKGWSKAAKGAAIGGASGAVVGAVVNKRNRVVGGVIGGIVGAGAGYGIGRTMDKKDGRY